ncbi:aldehyde dehydrogenase family protein [Alkalihalobacillus pseudalcaliphilus]|uniref:aldehyde dehydrogenase family protein n=1 Tax=Alkalihalobacillus pseudalcaliphilus TaxID=79884 RepID=UPI00064DDD0F|nr:aldehyde dehydrogenase family protein [Alkalihalobacillus pseudalcaliphilus]KMK76221.1 aldehyde dehydrogenase [Alkalihalobacillus pseudalcaliphilus]
MRNYTKHYINGEWVESTGTDTIDVINPATEEIIGQISSGTEEDVHRAVMAAKEAFPYFSQTSREERIALLNNIVKEYENRKDDFVQIITEELGSPISKSESVQYEMGLQHFKQAAKELETFTFLEDRGGHVVQKDAIGVAGLITPWNFPTNQAATKLASAFAAGATVVLKPASKTPYAAIIMAEIFEKAGMPKGVFNLVNGSGSRVGNAISSHSDVAFVSFTGSGAVGEKIMKNAAEGIKKVSLELGGKSPLVILPDANIYKAAQTAVEGVANNAGQVCTAATRTIIPHSIKNEFVEAVKEIVANYPVGDPVKESTQMGPQVSKDQWETVQSYIQKGIDEGATLIAGGLGKPEGLETGYFSQLTVFSNVKNDMVIAQEEIFGPVMSIITYDDLDEAIEIANDTVYGLAGYVYGEEPKLLAHVAKSLKAGRITINNEDGDFQAPFGGFKQSGIGREWGDYGIEEFLEPKSILGLPNV